MHVTFWMVVMVVLAADANAEPAKADLANRAYFAGVVVRTDLGTQLTRASAGVRMGRMSWSVVLDPSGYLSKSQTDTDVMAEVELGRRGGWAAMAGWRLATVPILGNDYWHEKPFIGLSAPLPAMLWGNVRMRFGGEFALTVVKHGGELPTIGFWDEPGFGWMSCNWGLFLRAEAARGF